MDRSGPDSPDDCVNPWAGEAPRWWEEGWHGVIILLAGVGVGQGWRLIGFSDFWVAAGVFLAMYFVLRVLVTPLHELGHWLTLRSFGYDPSMQLRFLWKRAYVRLPSKWVPARHYHLSCAAPIVSITLVGVAVFVLFPASIVGDVAALVVLVNAMMSGNDIYQIYEGMVAREIDFVYYTVMDGWLVVWKTHTNE